MEAAAREITMDTPIGVVMAADTGGNNMAAETIGNNTAADTSGEKMAAYTRGNATKRISVSSKRQITIPLRYYEELGIDSEVECELKDGTIVIRPVKSEPTGEFDEFILADLIKEGYQGEELLEKFKEMRRKIRPAVLKMIAEAEEYVASGKGRLTLEELFGSEEDE